MKIKTMLAVRRMNRKIKRESLKLCRLKEQLTQTVLMSDGLPHTSNASSKIERLTPLKLDAEKKIVKLEGVRKSIGKKLARLLEKSFAKFENYLFECETLIYRYCYDYSYRKIAQLINYSVGSVYRFHRTGLLCLGFNENDIHTLEAN